MASRSGYDASLHRNRALRCQDNPAALRTRGKPAEIHSGNLIGGENRNYLSIDMPGRTDRLRPLGMNMVEIQYK